MPSIIGDEPSTSIRAVRSLPYRELGRVLVVVCVVGVGVLVDGMCSRVRIFATEIEDRADRDPAAEAINAKLESKLNQCPTRVASATPAIQKIKAIASVESVWPTPAPAATRAACPRDQPRCRAISVIGAQ